MTLVLSANNTGHNVEFFSQGKVIYVYYEKQSPRIDPWGTLCFNVPKSEKNF